MIIYNKTWLSNQRLYIELEREMQQGRITADELTAIKAKYPAGFYTPNIFVRAGLFILTFIIVSLAYGLLSLIANSASIVNTGAWFLFLGLLSYFALEVMVTANNHLCPGVDDALLIISASMVVIGFYMIIDKNTDAVWEHLSMSLIIFAVSMFLSLRFADLLATAACVASFFAVIFYGWTGIVPSGLITAPFIMMLASGAMCWLIRGNAREEKFIHYQNCLIITQVISLLVFYAAGNYYIIQTLGNERHRQPNERSRSFWCVLLGLDCFTSIYLYRHWYQEKGRYPVAYRSGIDCRSHIYFS